MFDHLSFLKAFAAVFLFSNPPKSTPSPLAQNTWKSSLAFNCLPSSLFAFSCDGFSRVGKILLRDSSRPAESIKGWIALKVGNRLGVESNLLWTYGSWRCLLHFCAMIHLLLQHCNNDVPKFVVLNLAV